MILTSLQKNQLFHQIKGIIKTKNPNDATSEILVIFEETFREIIGNSQKDIEETEEKVAGELSPIFRRMG